MTYIKWLLYKATSPFDDVVLQGHVITKSHYISTTRVFMASKLDRIVTYLDGLLLIYSPDPLIT